MVKFSRLTDPHPPSLSFSMCFWLPLCGPWSPPLALWPLTSTPSVLLSTHCIPSKSPRVKPAAMKVKMHLFPGPFVQGCHYTGCDQATKFSAKINQPPPVTLSLCIPREMHPQAECLLSFMAPHPWQRTCSLFILLSIPPLLYPPSFWSYRALLSTLSHNPYPFFSLLSSTFPPLSPDFYFGVPLYSHLIFSRLFYL